jgi:ABC-type bacteriocin/lantibiotic exporter with double-glycine peptidase domain
VPSWSAVSLLFSDSHRVLLEIETAGTIRVDGVDTSRVGMHTLRRNLAIIPQVGSRF